MARRKAGVSLPDEDIHRFHRVIVVALHLRGLELRAGVVTPGRSSMLEAEAVAAVIVAVSRFGERPATAAGRVRCRFFHDNNDVQVRRLKNGGGWRDCLHCGWCSLRWHPSAPWGFRGPMSRTGILRVHSYAVEEGGIEPPLRPTLLPPVAPDGCESSYTVP